MMLFLSCFLNLICQRTPTFARLNGFEPLTLGFGIRCSTNWSYWPTRENKNLKKLVSNSNTQQDTKELNNLRLENQKLRKMIENFKLQSGVTPKEPSIMENPDSVLI